MEEISSLTSKLIQFPSINPPTSEESMRSIAAYIKDWFRENGIETRIKEYQKGWPTVIAEIGNGKKTVLINGHFDVVPTGDENSWKRKPFGGEIVEGKIFGRGASDMKSGVALAMILLRDLADKINYKLIFTGVSDEETGGFNCSRFISQEYNPDLVLITEPSGPSSIIIGEKGLLQLRLKAKGIPAHGSVPSMGLNAIELLIKDLLNLSNISKLELNIPQELRQILENTIIRLKEELGKELKEVKTISFNIGLIKGGVKVNVVADYCEAEVDMRIPPGITFDEAYEKAKSFVNNSSVEIIQKSNPNYTSPNNEYVQKLKMVIEKKLATKAMEIIITGATDGRYFREKGIPVIIYGPGKLGQAHVYDEHVLIEDLNKCYVVLKELLLSLN